MFIGLNIGLNNAITGLTQDQLSKTIKSLFSKNEQGVWYDPSDFSTMFQDAAGTTPVTAVEQPVGLILDKSGRGNHATQATTTSRPTLSARVNLLTYTEQFDNVAWVKNGATVAANSTTAPDGFLTAEKIIVSSGVSTTGGDDHGGVFQVLSVSASTPYVFSFFAKAAELSSVKIRESSSSGTIVSINLETGSVTYNVGNSTNVLVSTALVGDGWYRIQCTRTTGASQLTWVMPIKPGIDTGDGTSGVYIWGADFRPTNAGVNLPPYQRVGASTDYDTAGFPHYLKFDGIDDSLVTNSIDFTATDKMTVFAGVRKLSDALGLCLYELSAAIDTNAGTFDARVPAAGSQPNYLLRSKGTSASSATTPSSYAAPHTSVLTHVASIGDDINKVRVNGTQVASSTSDQGTGNYGNYPLYIGSRAGTVLRFNGQLYGLVIRGALSSTGEIQGSESYMNLHTGAY